MGSSAWLTLPATCCLPPRTIADTALAAVPAFSSSARSVLYAPLGFFLQNPVGDMLVAFTKDQDILDENLMDTLHYLGIYGLIMLSTIITVSVTIPHFAAFGGVLFIVTIIMLRYYLPAATQLKKQRADTAGESS
jgi:ABC-type multidrug transport system fused ATPase/permease subunit